MTYRSRTIDTLITEYLQAFGGLLIEGPRGCGKTETGLHHSTSSVRLDLSPQIINLVDLNPQAVLNGDTPRLIDEWQLSPDIWNVARHEIDDRQSPGQFIFSGSATPPPDPARHSGAGRIGRLKMHTMTLSELGESTGEVSLDALRGASTQLSAHSTLTYERLATLAVRGGWPGLLGSSDKAAIRFNRSYCEDICTAGIIAPEGSRHDPIRMRRLLSSIARRLAGEATLRGLARDVSGDEATMTPETARAYLDSLTQIFCLEELPAWSVKLRSRSRLRTPPKLHFSDPALATATLGIAAERLAHDPEYFGQVFESMVIHDLRVYAQTHDGNVFHYRDNTGLEIDAIIEYSWNDWAGVEVKLGWKEIKKAEQNLLKLRDERVDTGIAGKPAFLAVVTGTEYAYTLPSGVHIIPLGVLGA